jgi:hypothetical protein
MSEIDEQAVVERLVAQVNEYARGRESDVGRGAETPRLAALLLQKYGRGVCDAVSTIFGSPRAADPVSRAVDAATERIDPDWRQHDRERWAGRPADVIAKA